MLRLCMCVCTSKCIQQKCKMCGVAPQQEKKSGKMTLNSPHLTLCGAGGRPAGLMCAHALTHTRPGQSPEASVATWRARIMTSIMSPYSEAE